MALVGSLVVSLAAKTDQLEKDLAKARGEISKLKASVQDTQKGFGDLGGSMSSLVKGGAAIAGVTLSLGLLKTAISDVVKAGIEMQSLRVSFAAVSGGAAEGAKQFQYVVGLADKLGASFTDLAASYKGITAASQGTSLAGDKTKAIFEALATAGRTLGQSNEQMQGTLLAAQQMMSKGVVQAEELRGQWGERLPGAFNIAARAMGVTTAELGKMLETGKVLSEDFLPKFAAQLKKELGGGAQEAANTAGAAFNRLGNEWTLLKARIAQSGPLVFVANLAGSAAALLTGGTKADADIEKRAAKLLGPGASQSDLDHAKDVLRKGGENDVSLNTISGIQAKAGFRRLEASGGAAGKYYETNDAETEAVRKKSEEINKLLGETNTKLEEQAKLNQIAPERLGASTDAAKRKTAELNEQLKVQKDQLEAIAKVALATNGAMDAEQQKKTDALRASIRAGESQIKAIEDGEAAKRKAESAADSAARKAEHEREAAAKNAAKEAQERLQEDINNVFKNEQAQSDLMETLQKLAGKYTTVQEARDADTASMLRGQLATTVYADEAERLAKVIEDVQRVESQLPGLRADADRSAAQFESNKTGNAALDHYEELLGLGPSRDAREYLKARSTLTGAEGLDPDRVKNVLRQLEPEFRKLKNTANEFADSFLSAIERATTGGVKSFKDFVGSVLMDMTRILQKNYLTPFLGKLVEQGLNFGINAIGGSAPGGTATAAGAAAVGYTGEGPFLGNYASGGDVRSTGWQMVGENGPERVWLNQGDHVSPSGAERSVNVTFHISTPDAQSFRRSQGEIQRSLVGAIRSSDRNG